MRLILLDAFSEPGSAARPNDDAWCAADGMAAVLDGATGLGERLLPGPSDAAWVAARGAESLKRHAGTLRGTDLLRAAMAEVEAAFLAERLRPPAETYELPMASLMMVDAAPGGGLAARWFGDCGGLVRRPGEPVQLLGEAFDKRAGESAGAAALAQAHGVSSTAGLGRPEFLEALRAARNRFNGRGGAWVFAPDARGAEHAGEAVAAAPPGTLVLLGTDGFLALATDYGRHDPESLLRAAESDGLAALAAELRAVERADPAGERFPRFKTSDDATALLLRVEG